MLQFTTPSGKYSITSHGNGWAYEVHCNTTGDSLWFQDQDADYLRDTTDNLTIEGAIDLYFVSMFD
jgi:hypothetical protein